MKTLTQEERVLLDALETLAARMQNISAVLEMLQDTAPFCEGVQETQAALALRRMRAVRVLESVEHLAAYYYNEAGQLVDGYYGG